MIPKKKRFATLDNAQRFLMIIKKPLGYSLYAEAILIPVQFLILKNRELTTFKALRDDFIPLFFNDEIRLEKFDVIARPLHRWYFKDIGTRAPAIRLQTTGLDVTPDLSLSCQSTSCKLAFLNSTDIAHDGPAVVVYEKWVSKLWEYCWKAQVDNLWLRRVEMTKSAYDRQFPAWPKTDLVQHRNFYTEATTFPSIKGYSTDTEGIYLSIMMLSHFFRKFRKKKTLGEKWSDVEVLKLASRKTKNSGRIQTDFQKVMCEPVSAKVCFDLELGQPQVS